MDLKHISLLLVEDDPDYELLIRKDLAGLKQFRFTIHSVYSLSEAKEWLNQKSVDCVLLDLTLPDSQGIQTYSELQIAATHVPIVVMTGLKDKDFAFELLEHGAQDYLIKGEFSSDRLARSLIYAIERKQTHVEIEKLASFPELNPDPIFEINLAGQLTYLNPATKNKFPDLEEKALQHPLLSNWGKHLELLQLKKSMIMFESNLKEYQYECRAYAIQGQEKFRVYVLDVTERKKVEKMKDEFIHHVNHEMRSPMASIRGALSLFKDKSGNFLNKDQAQLIEIALRNTDILGRMVNDLIESTQSGIGRMSVHLRRSKVEPIVSSVMESFKSFANQKNIELGYSFEPNLPYVLVDSLRTEQILTNLVDNAIKFTEKNGKVEVHVGLEENSDFVLISVCDNGIGVVENEFEKIFEKFYRSPESQKVNRKGLGLGLYIARELVQYQGGKVWLKSELEKGSTFYFTLPCFSLAYLLKDYVKEITQKSFMSQIIQFCVFSEQGHTLTDSAFRECMGKVKESIKINLYGEDVLFPEMEQEELLGYVFVMIGADPSGAEIACQRIQKKINKMEEFELNDLKIKFRLIAFPFHSATVSGRDYLTVFSKEVEKQLFSLIQKSHSSF